MSEIAKNGELTEAEIRLTSDYEMTLLDLVNILDSSIVHDRKNKVLVFLGTLLNYTDRDQMAMGFSAASSTGKTYIATEILSYFPQEDIITLGYASPKAFYHDYGVLSDAETLEPIKGKFEYVEEKYIVWLIENPPPDKRGKKTEWKDKSQLAKRQFADEWEQTEKVNVVNLHQKILVFLDQPNDELLQRLRPLLSKDRKYIKIKISDRDSSQAHRTKHVVLVGYPTVIFLSTSFNMNAAERTRIVMFSPEVTQAKLTASIEMLAEKLKDRNAYTGKLYEDMDRANLQERVRRIAKEAQNTREIIITDEDMDYIRDKFLEEHPTLIPRNQRDFPHLVGFIKATALLNYYQRERYDGKLFATRSDVDEGYKQYESIAESNELGLTPEVYDLYSNKIKTVFDAGGSLTRRELATEYFKLFKVRAGKNRIKNVVDILVEVGLAIEMPDPRDNRRMRLYSATQEDAPESEEPEADPPKPKQTNF